MLPYTYSCEDGLNAYPSFTLHANLADLAAAHEALAAQDVSGLDVSITTRIIDQILVHKHARQSHAANSQRPRLPPKEVSASPFSRNLHRKPKGVRSGRSQRLRISARLFPTLPGRAKVPSPGAGRKPNPRFGCES